MFIVETDASMDGFGAWSPTLALCLLGKFTALELASAQRTSSRSMGELELRAALIALHTFAHQLAGASVLFKVDNEEAYYALQKRSARPPNQRAIIADIADLCMTHNIFISAAYFPTPLPHCPMTPATGELTYSHAIRQRSSSPSRQRRHLRRPPHCDNRSAAGRRPASSDRHVRQQER